MLQQGDNVKGGLSPLAKPQWSRFAPKPNARKRRVQAPMVRPCACAQVCRFMRFATQPYGGRPPHPERPSGVRSSFATEQPAPAGCSYTNKCARAHRRPRRGPFGSLYLCASTRVARGGFVCLKQRAQHFFSLCVYQPPKALGCSLFSGTTPGRDRIRSPPAASPRVAVTKRARPNGG